ncbi:MAG: MBL fold metallo-hydrolase [Desulfobacteraceae bacterium]|nr:MAG: MBL fold metallo-hydrolase [Desulfobacteraceae bacterium]
MEAYAFSPEQLFGSVFKESGEFLLLDVRNNEEFEKFAIEGPFLTQMTNIPYFEFLEFEEESIAKIPRKNQIKIVCAKEGSAKYVADILTNAGFTDVGYLAGGIGTWADLLMPVEIAANEKYSIFQFIRPGKASLSYGLICADECFIFDPARTIDSYLDFSAQHGTRITAIFETHLQADYISGSQALAEASHAPIIAHEDDYRIASFEYDALRNGQVYSPEGSGIEIKAVHTPGHTPGSTSYLIDNQFLVSGDAVFIKSIGRPDLGGKVTEWSGLLFNTIVSVLKQMDDQIRVLPGHYMDWSEMDGSGRFIDSLRHIFDNNAAIYSIDDIHTFTDFIKANMRPQPEVYAQIRQVNAGLLTPPDEEQVIMDIGKNECAATHD